MAAATNIPYFIRTFNPTSGGGWKTCTLHESAGIAPDQSWVTYNADGSANDPITVNQKFTFFSITVATSNLVVAGSAFVNFENDPTDAQDMSPGGDYNIPINIGQTVNFYFPEGRARIRFIHGTPTTNISVTVYATNIDATTRTPPAGL